MTKNKSEIKRNTDQISFTCFEDWLVKNKIELTQGRSGHYFDFLKLTEEANLIRQLNQKIFWAQY